MVYVNSQKFACASCIKGHRSSSCHHTDRPLFEIKKKGRPVSQCDKCRELRKNKRMHVKCNCTSISESTDLSNNVMESSSTFKVPEMPHRPSQRKLPSNPTLPNGIKDLWVQETNSVDPHSKQRVANLLNPCKCKSVWNCQCLYGGEHPPAKPSNKSSRDNNITRPVITVKSCCGGDETVSDLSPDKRSTASYGTRMPTPSAAAHREQRLLANMPYPQSSYARSPDLSIPTSSLRETVYEQDNIGLILPPLLSSGVGECDSSSIQELPSLRLCEPVLDTTHVDAMHSLTRCGCGSHCACPGCKEHRGDDLAALSGEDCPDKCGSCVDHMSGLALPPSSSVSVSSPTSESSKGLSEHLHTSSHTAHSSAGMSSLDHFYAIAALLPQPPPASRNMDPGALDATNLVVYNGKGAQNWHKAAGLVQVPALNCCAGMCRCPGGMCGCGSQCGGSCGHHSANSHTAKGKWRHSRNEVGQEAGKENGGQRATGRCCTGKTLASPAGSRTSSSVSRL